MATAKSLLLFHLIYPTTITVSFWRFFCTKMILWTYDLHTCIQNQPAKANPSILFYGPCVTHYHKYAAYINIMGFHPVVTALRIKEIGRKFTFSRVKIMQYIISLESFHFCDTFVGTDAWCVSVSAHPKSLASRSCLWYSHGIPSTKRPEIEEGFCRNIQLWKRFPTIAPSMPASNFEKHKDSYWRHNLFYTEIPYVPGSRGRKEIYSNEEQSIGMNHNEGLEAGKTLSAMERVMSSMGIPRNPAIDPMYSQRRG